MKFKSFGSFTTDIELTHISRSRLCREPKSLKVSNSYTYFVHVEDPYMCKFKDSDRFFVVVPNLMMSM